jgi:transcriptional regulator with GAF, ATPase, and Fis domain
VTRADGAASEMRVRRCRLVVEAGPDAGLAKELGSTWFQVGAAPSCDLCLSDRKVSGHHFEIRIDERGYRLRDLESTNGTFLAGFRVRDVYLNPSSLIAVGDTGIRFEPLESSVPIEVSERDRVAGMVGSSLAMRALFARVERVAPTDATVLVSGETGTGKELVAEALHEESPRARGPFVIVDCSSIPDQLFESELFGHERGAFTGAVNAHAGAFERAHGGTVFLDEIGELPLELQPKLLRALDSRSIRRVGGGQTISVDMRVIAATNRDLAVEMNRGRFREDLYYRLAVVCIRVPPLRDRREDIPLLVQHFLEEIPSGARVRLRPETLAALARHDYPGNVRELRNLIERVVALAGARGDPRLILPDELPPVQSGNAGTSAPSPAAEMLVVAVDETVPLKRARKQMGDEFDRRYLRRLLVRHKGNVSAAARAAGLDRMTVYKMLNRLDLTNPRDRGRGRG